MRSGVSSVTPSGGAANEGLVGVFEWQVTQRVWTMACAVANEIFGPSASAGSISSACGAVIATTLASAAAVPANTTGCVRARKFMTYFAPAPATNSKDSSAHARGCPYNPGKWLDSIVKSTGSVT